jgi:hypothetical protein
MSIKFDRIFKKICQRVTLIYFCPVLGQVKGDKLAIGKNKLHFLKFILVFNNNRLSHHKYSIYSFPHNFMLFYFLDIILIMT